MILGRNGDIIKQIRFDTGARVNISSDAPGKSHAVFSILCDEASWLILTDYVVALQQACGQ